MIAAGEPGRAGHVVNGQRPPRPRRVVLRRPVPGQRMVEVHLAALDRPRDRHHFADLGVLRRAEPGADLGEVGHGAQMVEGVEVLLLAVPPAVRAGYHPHAAVVDVGVVERHPRRHRSHGIDARPQRRVLVPTGGAAGPGRLVLHLVVPHLQVGIAGQLADAADDGGMVDEPFEGRRCLPDVEDLPHRPFRLEGAEQHRARVAGGEAVRPDGDDAVHLGRQLIHLGVVQEPAGVEKPVAPKGADLFGAEPGEGRRHLSPPLIAGVCVQGHHRRKCPPPCILCYTGSGAGRDHQEQPRPRRHRAGRAVPVRRSRPAVSSRGAAPSGEPPHAGGPHPHRGPARTSRRAGQQARHLLRHRAQGRRRAVDVVPRTGRRRPLAPARVPGPEPRRIHVGKAAPRTGGVPRLPAQQPGGHAGRRALHRRLRGVPRPRRSRPRTALQGGDRSEGPRPTVRGAVLGRRPALARVRARFRRAALRAHRRHQIQRLLLLERPRRQPLRRAAPVGDLPLIRLRALDRSLVPGAAARRRSPAALPGDVRRRRAGPRRRGVVEPGQRDPRAVRAVARPRQRRPPPRGDGPGAGGEHRRAALHRADPRLSHGGRGRGRHAPPAAAVALQAPRPGAGAGVREHRGRDPVLVRAVAGAVERRRARRLLAARPPRLPAAVRPPAVADSERLPRDLRSHRPGRAPGAGRLERRRPLAARAGDGRGAG